MPSPLSAPCAFISDIHGNLRALKAVLAELAQRGVKQIFVAGDLLLGGEEPLEVWRLLTEENASCTRGLSDTALASIDPLTLSPSDPDEAVKADRFSATRAAIGDLVCEQLRRLPTQLRLPLIDGREIVMVHASPRDASLEMSHDLSDEELLALTDDDPADIFVCGATHVPFQRPVGDVHVVNVGSIGAAPEGTIAHFTIITPTMSGAEILQDWLDYGR